MNTMTAPMPEMLSRRDMEPISGEWTIENCEAVRGAPYTDNVSKKMVVPHEDNDIARIIRAHEMMHAKLSPADDYLKWLERDMASDSAMKAVEEVRVNYFVAKAGFDVKLLTDGSEMPAGERIAKAGDWAGAVYSTIAFTGTGGLNQFLTGVRRHNKEWAEVLRELSRKITKEIEQADKKQLLSSTEKCKDTGLAPRGFYQVERLAQWVDSIANPPMDESKGTDDDDAVDEEVDETSTSSRKTVSKKPPVSSEAIKKGKPTTPSTGRIPTWANMSVERTPMPRRTKGGIGKKRRASNMGTNPRRISRLLTDPERRVFDSTKKGTGGVVLIDGSGSMQLSTSDIMRITEASAGCTVAVYSTFSGNIDGGRLFIVAEKGKMVDNVDNLNKGGGNGCDGLAVRWAVKEAKKGAPIVWVCDGIVTDWRDDAHDTLTLECVNLVTKHNIRMAENVEGAVKILADLKRGATPQHWLPYRFKRVIKKVSGGDA